MISPSRLASVLDGLGQHHGLGAVQRVLRDRGHLVHVFGGRVHDRIVRIQVAVVDWPIPLIGQQRQDLVCTFGGAAIGQLAILVVGEGDVLSVAEAVERGGSVLDPEVGVRTRPEETSPTMRTITPMMRRRDAIC